MTPQLRIKKLLEDALPLREVNVLGSTIILVADCEDTARRAFRLLQTFCTTVRQPAKSVAYNKHNEGTNLCPSTHFVWLVGASI